MPRTRRSTAARSQVLSGPTRSLVASATNYTKTPIKSTAVPSGTAFSRAKNPAKPAVVDWQSTAWTYYDSVGEYRYAVDWIGNLASRVKLVVFQNGAPTTDAKATDLLDALYGGPEGQAEMLRAIGKHWTVAGDCFIIGDSVDDPEKADWLVGAATQVSQDNNGLWKVNTEYFQKSAMVIRLWRPHPTDRTASDSPSQAVLPILSEIDGLTKYVAAQVDSRLAGNGILLIPDNISFGSASPEQPLSTEGANDDPPPPPKQDAQEFVRTLIQVASQAIADREDPNSLIPIVLQADGDALQHVRHVSLSTDLQTEAQSLRTEAIRRLALGMDMPPEILTGTSDMNHWSSWQIEEAAIKSHLEPLLAEIASALTEGYLRPGLDGKDSETFTIEADTTALRLRPNRSKEALELWDRGQLSLEALLRENGFDPINDKMPDKEFQTWLITKVASGSAAPEQVQAALEALGVDLKLQALPGGPGGYTGDQQDGGSGTNEARPTPTTKNHPTRNPPEAETPSPTPPAGGKTPATKPITPQQPSGGANLDDRVVFGGAMMVDRALERAGNRIKTKLGGKIRDSYGREVPAAQAYRAVKVDQGTSTLDDLLTDAWGPAVRFAREMEVDPKWLVSTLDGYTRGILQAGGAHTAASLRAYLADAPDAP